MNMALLSIAASFVLVVTLAGCSSDDGVASGIRSSDEVTTTAPASMTTVAEQVDIEALVAAFVADSPSGVDVFFQRNGEVHRVVAGVGTADGDPIVVGQSFRVGSISKSFVAVMVLQLVEEGSVDLDATLDTYLPDTTVGGDVTVRQLLSHQSGIPSYTDQPDFFAEVFVDLDRSLTTADILGFIEEVPVRAAGSFAYSNTNYILLGQLVEELDGNELNASLRDRVNTPLGLSTTFFDTSAEDVPDDLVPGWTSSGGPLMPTPAYESISTSAWAAGALVSNTNDLAAFLAALSNGELISADSFAAMTDLGPGGNGLGIFQVSFSATQTGFGHGGSIPGYSSTMAIDPNTGDLLVILTADDSLVADRLALQILQEL